MDCDALVRILVRARIDYVVCVPCQEISALLLAINDHGGIRVIVPSREDDGLGLLLGLRLSGKRCLGLFQDTLLGNSQNAIGLLARCTGVTLSLWLASRGGAFLAENLVHEYITGNFEQLTADSALATWQVELTLQGAQPLSATSVATLSESLAPARPRPLNIVQLLVS